MVRNPASLTAAATRTTRAGEGNGVRWQAASWSCRCAVSSRRSQQPRRWISATAATRQCCDAFRGSTGPPGRRWRLLPSAIGGCCCCPAHPLKMVAGDLTAAPCFRVRPRSRSRPSSANESCRTFGSAILPGRRSFVSCCQPACKRGVVGLFDSSDLYEQSYYCGLGRFLCTSPERARGRLG